MRDVLRDATFPWFIAGGWVWDLYLGHPTRAHHDIDIAVFRDDIGKVRDLLQGWEHFIAESGTLTPWREAGLPTAAHELWSREQGRDAWQIEILIEEKRGDRWAYRRNADIGLHARDIGRLSAEGIPYIRPEIQLLYKSKGTRPSDESDFITVLPHLDVAQKGFLAAALWTTSPGHRWLGRLT